MNLRRCLACVVLAATLGPACNAPLAIEPGLSAVRIEVRAVPKRGSVRPSTPPRAGDDVYDVEPTTSGAAQEAGAFERVDYRALDDIVVWIEPLFDVTGVASARNDPPVVIPVGPLSSSRPSDVPLLVTGVGGRLDFMNRTGRDEVIYSLSDANPFDTGVLPPGGLASYRTVSPGVIDVLCESRDEPIALVYASPTRWVGLGRSGSEVVFTDLPPGRYRASCWHRRLPGSFKVVDLVADRVGRVAVSVGVDVLPEID